MSELARIHWHCRRGLLELDLVLAAFLERHLDRLDAQLTESYDAQHLALRARPLRDAVCAGGRLQRGGHVVGVSIREVDYALFFDQMPGARQ